MIACALPGRIKRFVGAWAVVKGSGFAVDAQPYIVDCQAGNDLLPFHGFVPFVLFYTRSMNM